jgi:hypothetical protein
MDIVGDYGLVIEKLGNSLKESKEMDGIEEWQLAIHASKFTKKRERSILKIFWHTLYSLDKNIAKKYCIENIWKKRAATQMEKGKR